jgi:hypothetical protein
MTVFLRWERRSSGCAVGCIAKAWRDPGSSVFEQGRHLGERWTIIANGLAGDKTGRHENGNKSPRESGGINDMIIRKKINK